MARFVTKGSTNVSDYIYIQDSADGTAETGIAAGSPTPVLMQYVRDNTAPVAAVAPGGGSLTAHSDNTFILVDDTDQPGLYKFDWPDAAFASGVDHVVCTVNGSGLAPVHREFILTDVDLFDSVRGGMTALPNAAAGSAGGLADDTDANGRTRIVDGTGAGEIATTSGAVDTVTTVTNQVTADVTQVSGNTPAADNLQAAYDGTGYVGGTILPRVNIWEISDDTTSATNLEAYTDGTTPMPVNLTQWIGVAPLALVSQRVEALASAMAAGVIDSAAIATDAIGAAELAADAVTEITDDIMAEVVESQGSYTVQQVLSILLAVLAGETSNSGNTIASPDGVATRVAATTNASNERTAMTLTPSS